MPTPRVATTPTTPNRTHPDDLWLEVGRILKPHGLHGDLAMRSQSGSLDPFPPGRLIRAVRRDGRPVDMVLRSVRPFKDGAIISCDEITDPAAADALRGAAVLVRRVDLDPPAAGEVYVRDLIGLVARLPDGRELGPVVDAVDTGPVLTLMIALDGGDERAAVPYHEEWTGPPDFDRGVLPLRRGPVR